METLRRLCELAKLESRIYSVWHASPETPASLAQLPFRVGSGTWSGVLVDEEVGIRLGNFSTPSTAFVSATNDPNDVHDGQITLIGPDLYAITQPTIPFALGTIIYLEKVTPETVKALNRTLQVRDEIEGFMQRSQRGDPRYLVGNVLLQRKASFQHLGRAFLHLFRNQFPRDIQKCEIVFLTSLPSRINEMKQFREQATHEIAKAWQVKIQKFDKLRADCEFEWECKACDYQKICEELRDIIRLREREKSASTK